MKNENKEPNQRPIHGVLFDPILPLDNNQQVDEDGIKNRLERKQLIEPIIFDYSSRPPENNSTQKNLEYGKLIKPIIYSDPRHLPTQIANKPQLEQNQAKPQLQRAEAQHNKNTVPAPIESQHMQPWKRIPKQTNSNPLTKSITKPAKITPEAIKEKVLTKISIFVQDEFVYIYNGICYEPVTDNQLQKMVYSICNTEIKENGHINFINESCKFIKLEPSIQYADSLHNSHILTFLNGNLNLIDGQLYEHSPQVITCYALQCNYLSNQQKLNTPYFDTLLENISGGNAEIKQRIWQMFGYCLAPDTKAKKVFLLQGARHSGKSLLCRLLASFFPKSAISALNAHDFSSKFALSELENKALCVSADMSADPLNARTISNIKQLSGDDLISAAKNIPTIANLIFLVS